MTDPGLPLTTGEGNTARDERLREWVKAEDGRRHGLDIESLLAERGRLREQLDAARDHLREGLSTIHASSDHPERLLEGKPSGLDDAWAAGDGQP